MAALSPGDSLMMSARSSAGKSAGPFGSVQRRWPRRGRAVRGPWRLSQRTADRGKNVFFMVPWRERGGRSGPRRTGANFGRRGFKPSSGPCLGRLFVFMCRPQTPCIIGRIVESRPQDITGPPGYLRTRLRRTQQIKHARPMHIQTISKATLRRCCFLWGWCTASASSIPLIKCSCSVSSRCATIEFVLARAWYASMTCPFAIDLPVHILIKTNLQALHSASLF